MRVLLRYLAAAILAAFAAGPAYAHAVLLTTDPVANAVVASAPAEVMLGFNEPVSLLAASLITPGGEQIAIDPAGLGGEYLAVPLPGGLGQGTHLLSWRVASIDGHPVGGTTVFSVGVVTGGIVEAAGHPAVVGLLLASKVLIYLGVTLGIGGAVFAVASGELPGLAARTAKTAAFAGAVATPVSLGLHGVDALGLALTGFFSAAAWSAGLATSYGMTVLALLVALTGALMSFMTPKKSWSVAFAVAAWAAAAAAFAISGHAGSAEPQWLTRPAVFLHLGGIVLWVGALVPLAVLLLRAPEHAVRPLARFSAFVPYPVAALLVSGLALAMTQLGPDTEYWFSPHGYILAAKLALVAVLFGLAIWNRWALTGPALLGDSRAARRLAGSIVLEIVVVIAILALVAGWRFTPPPRALTLQASVPIAFHIHTNTAMADVAIEPGRVGFNTISVYLMDGEFAPVEPVSVVAAISAPDRGIEASRFEAVLDDDGFWRLYDVRLPVAADWQFDLEIRLSRFEMVRLSETFTLP
ncbi:copper resistance CopC/CopD family protein [Pelagibacterium limicola]|uniref:copper resistance CopC/CopD family protein n=1 Tax=Pelagibacterium limicola TaxID=2791022 RepID=UPI0018B014FC|nr:copper resistance protein CopC [Pelagibacterium limicola]